MKVVVSEKGQVTIPKTLRTRLGIRSGQVLIFRERQGQLVAIKQPQADGMDRVYGILKSKNKTDVLIRQLRGNVDAV